MRRCPALLYLAIEFVILFNRAAVELEPLNAAQREDLVRTVDGMLRRHEEVPINALLARDLIMGEVFGMLGVPA